MRAKPSLTSEAMECKKGELKSLATGTKEGVEQQTTCMPKFFSFKDFQHSYEISTGFQMVITTKARFLALIF